MHEASGEFSLGLLARCRSQEFWTADVADAFPKLGASP
jgi:hypothetical protein